MGTGPASAGTNRLWDYDLPVAPNLINVRVNGTQVKAIAQAGLLQSRNVAPYLLG
jgi:glucose dehydrogenase